MLPMDALNIFVLMVHHWARTIIFADLVHAICLAATVKAVVDEIPKATMKKKRDACIDCDSRNHNDENYNL